MRPIKKYLAIVAILASASLFTACAAYMPPPPLPPTPTAAPGISIPFEPVAVGINSGFDAANSQLVLAYDAHELDLIAERLHEPVAIDALHAVDLGEYVVVALFRSPVGSSGFGVNITQIIVDNNTVQVYAEFSQPQSNQGVTPATTRPYQAIKVMRSELPDEENEWVLVSYPTYDPTPTPFPPPQPTPTDVPGTSVAFNIIAEGSRIHFTDETTQLIVANTEAELETLLELLQDAETMAALQAADLAEDAIIGIVYPVQQRLGHQLKITRILVDENVATLYTEFRPPSRVEFTAYAPNSPYIVATVPHAALPEGEIEWVLVSYPMVAGWPSVSPLPLPTPAEE